MTKAELIIILHLFKYKQKVMYSLLLLGLKYKTNLNLVMRKIIVEPIVKQ